MWETPEEDEEPGWVRPGRTLLPWPMRKDNFCLLSGSAISVGLLGAWEVQVEVEVEVEDDADEEDDEAEDRPAPVLVEVLLLLPALLPYRKPLWYARPLT